MQIISAQCDDANITNDNVRIMAAVRWDVAGCLKCGTHYGWVVSCFQYIYI